MQLDQVKEHDAAQTIDCDIVTISLKDDIVRFVYKPGAIFTEKDFYEVQKAVTKLIGGKPHPVFIDAREIKATTRAAEKLADQPEVVKSIRARALLVKSAISKAMVNMYLQLSPPKMPTQLFTSEKKAMQWLRSFVVER